jgi:hypothetical protein
VRENGVRSFFSRSELIGTGLVYSGPIGTVYKGRKRNRIILVKVLDVYAMRCVNTGRKGINPADKPHHTMQFIKRNSDDIIFWFQFALNCVPIALVVKFVIFAYSYTP